MKIAWFGINAPGHMEAALPLIKALTRAGHSVVCFSFESCRESVLKAGADFAACDSADFHLEEASYAERFFTDSAYASAQIVSALICLEPLIERTLNAFGPDLIAADPLAYWGKLTAIRRALPYLSCVCTLAVNHNGEGYMKSSHTDLLKLALSYPRIFGQIRRLRERGYGVKGIRELLQDDEKTHSIVCTSSYFQPYAGSFDKRVRFIGPVLSEPAGRFEKRGRYTVCVFWDTADFDQDLFGNVIKALDEPDWQVILCVGAAADASSLPAGMRLCRREERMGTLPIADALVTRCSLQDASEGLYFDVPLVLCPRTREQEAVAKRAAELGAGLCPGGSSPGEVKRAVERVLYEPSFRQAAARISESFHRCGGAAQAIQYMERLCAHGRPPQRKKKGETKRKAND